MSRLPDHAGPGGRAWLIPNRSHVPAHAACIAQYLVDVPRVHPFWHRWTLSVVHLRPIDGTKPARITRAGATHEMMIMAIHPDWKPDDAAEDFGISGGVPWLEPFDFVDQFTVPDDDAARSVAELSVRAIVDGRISPDSDYRRAWQAVIARMAEKLRGAS